MGKITIKIEGSFPSNGVSEHSALYGGHAAAIGRGIKILTDLLPDAIALDHELHTKGEMPPRESFGRGPGQSRAG